MLYRFLEKAVNKNRFYFWIVFIALAMPLPSHTQENNPQFYKEITLHHKPYSLQSLTEEIQAQSGISFSYDAEKIDPNTKIVLKKDKLTVAAILTIVKKNTGIGYKIISKTHFIYTKPASTKKPKSKFIKTKSKQEKHTTFSANPVIKAKTIVEENKETIATPPQTITSKKVFVDTMNGSNSAPAIDSNLAMSYYMNGGGGFIGGGGGGGGTEDDEILNKKIKLSKQNKRSWHRESSTAEEFSSDKSNANQLLSYLQSNTLLALGFSADETYYFAPSFRAGLNYLYGTFSYNLGGINSWRYGIGASAKIDDHWRMHFNISTGQTVSKNYDIITNDTTTANNPTEPPVIIEHHTPLLVSAKLARYSISANWSIGKGLSIEAGLMLNRLKTKYSSNSVPINLSEILPIGYDADEKYPAIKPPYLLGNSYTGSQTYNSKLWLGIQLTVLYTMPFQND